MLAALAALCSLASPTIRYGEVDLTPPEPLPLGGYTARGGKLCELSGDRLAARILLIEAPDTRIAIVACDLLTIPESLFRAVAERVGEHTDVFLAATHTHCAPDSQMLNQRMDFSIPGIAKYQPEWAAWFADRLAAGVRTAQARPAEPFGRAEIGFARLALNRGRRAFAPADTLAVRVRDRANRLAVTHYAAHAVLYGPAENRPRTDFPGWIRGDRGVFLPGAIGDMSPASTGSTPEAQVAEFARRFEAGPWRWESWPMVPMRFLTRPIHLGPVQPNPEFARLNKIPEPLSQSVVRRFAPETGQITAIRLGKLAIIGVSGEPSAELGRQIRSIGLGLGFRAVLTVSHVNGWAGYILTPEDYDRGGYEASLGFHGREAGLRVVEAAREALLALSHR